MAIDDLTIKPSDFALHYCHAGAGEAGITPEEFAARLIEAIAYDDLVAQENAAVHTEGGKLFKPHLRVAGDPIVGYAQTNE